MSDGTERDFEAEEENGVYLVEVESAYDGYIFYSTSDYTLVDSVSINGQYIGTSASFEMECDDFHFTGDGGVDIRCVSTGSDRS